MKSIAFVAVLLACTAALAAEPVLPVSALAARDLVNQEAMVCGTVVKTYFAREAKGQPTFLNLETTSDKDGATVVIWGSNRESFGEPEKRYADTRICVTSWVELYREKVSLTVKEPAQIHVVVGGVGADVEPGRDPLRRTLDWVDWASVAVEGRCKPFPGVDRVFEGRVCWTEAEQKLDWSRVKDQSDMGRFRVVTTLLEQQLAKKFGKGLAKTCEASFRERLWGFLSTDFALVDASKRAETSDTVKPLLKEMSRRVGTSLDVQDLRDLMIDVGVPQCGG